MDGAINSYDGPGFVGTGAAPRTKRDGVRLSHRELMTKFIQLGTEQLNLNDFNRTAHLPIGRGRLACDPETGDFDKDAARPVYNEKAHGFYPRHVHSTITQGEFLVVKDQEEHQLALASKKWSDLPMPIKRAYVLTDVDQITALKSQVEAERYRSNVMEKRFDEVLSGVAPGNVDAKENQSLQSKQIADQAAQIEDLKARMEMLMARLESKPTPDEDEDEEEESVAVATGAARGRRR